MSKIIGVTVGTPTSPAKMEQELKPVKTVNGIVPDENGNVVVEGGGGALQVDDDGNGNVTLRNVPRTDDDRIVEQGVKDKWSYRKWASGVAECWRSVTATVKTTDWKDSGMMSFPLLQNFGLFWTKEMVAGRDIQFAYPFAFASRPVETACLTNGTVWFPLSLISTTGKHLDRTDSYRLCTYKTPEQNIEVTISLHVVGKWK
jgi:hypothetical protein